MSGTQSSSIVWVLGFPFKKLDGHLSIFLSSSNKNQVKLLSSFLFFFKKSEKIVRWCCGRRFFASPDSLPRARPRRPPARTRAFGGFHCVTGTKGLGGLGLDVPPLSFCGRIRKGEKNRRLLNFTRRASWQHARLHAQRCSMLTAPCSRRPGLQRSSFSSTGAEAEAELQTNLNQCISEF